MNLVPKEDNNRKRWGVDFAMDDEQHYEMLRLWMEAEKKLNNSEEKLKKSFDNLVVFGTTDPGNVSFEDCPACK